MCIKCAVKKLRRLYSTEGRKYFDQVQRYFVCVVDHGDHIHIRFNGTNESGDWHTLPCSLEQFKVIATCANDVVVGGASSYLLCYVCVDGGG